MIFNIIGFVIGMMILCSGIYYFAKEKNDIQSRRIYGATICAGALIVVFIAVRILFFG